MSRFIVSSPVSTTIVPIRRIRCPKVCFMSTRSSCVYGIISVFLFRIPSSRMILLSVMTYRVVLRFSSAMMNATRARKREDREDRADRQASQGRVPKGRGKPPRKLDEEGSRHDQGEDHRAPPSEGDEPRRSRHQQGLLARIGHGLPSAAFIRRGR